MTRFRYDYRDENGVGYIIEGTPGGYGWRWVWFDKESDGTHRVMSQSQHVHPSPWAAMRDAAEDWDLNGSTENKKQKRSHTLRRVATGLEKESWAVRRGPR